MKVKKRGRGAPRGYNGAALGSRAAVALGASGSQAAGRAGLPAKGMIMHSPRWRRATRAAALAASLACGALYAQTVNLKPGKYELVSTSQVTLPPAMVKGLPPGYLERLQKPRTRQQCIADTDLAKLSKQLSEERNDASCRMTAHTVTGKEVKFVMQCQRATSHFEGTFSSDSFKAVINSKTDQGQTIRSSMTGRRVGDCAK